MTFENEIPTFRKAALLAGKIQVSNSTNMILDMQGGFVTVERGGVEIKVNLYTFPILLKRQAEFNVTSKLCSDIRL